MDLITAHEKLLFIYQNCSVDAAQQDKSDDFLASKRKIHLLVKEVRQTLKDRARLLVKKTISNNRQAAEISYKVRIKLKTIRNEIDLMMENIKRDEKTLNKLKGKKATNLQEALREKRQVYELCLQHLEECEGLEKQRYDFPRSDRDALIGTASPSGLSYHSNISYSSTHDSELPDIDVENDMKTLQKGDQEIQKDLQIISTGVATLKTIAIGMNDELDMQNELLSRMDKKTGKIEKEMNKLNVKMKDTLDRVMTGDKFIVNCVLVVILLGIAAFIGSFFF